MTRKLCKSNIKLKTDGSMASKDIVYPNEGQHIESHWKLCPTTADSWFKGLKKKKMSDIVIHAMLQNLIIHKHDSHYELSLWHFFLAQIVPKQGKFLKETYTCGQTQNRSIRQITEKTINRIRLIGPDMRGKSDTFHRVKQISNTAVALSIGMTRKKITCLSVIWVTILIDIKSGQIILTTQPQIPDPTLSMAILHQGWERVMLHSSMS